MERVRANYRPPDLSVLRSMAAPSQESMREAERRAVDVSELSQPRPPLGAQPVAMADTATVGDASVADSSMVPKQSTLGDSLEDFGSDDDTESEGDVHPLGAPMGAPSAALHKPSSAGAEKSLATTGFDSDSD